MSQSTNFFSEYSRSSTDRTMDCHYVAPSCRGTTACVPWYLLSKHLLSCKHCWWPPQPLHHRQAGTTLPPRAIVLPHATILAIPWAQYRQPPCMVFITMLGFFLPTRVLCHASTCDRHTFMPPLIQPTTPLSTTTTTLIASSFTTSPTNIPSLLRLLWHAITVSFPGRHDTHLLEASFGSLLASHIVHDGLCLCALNTGNIDTCLCPEVSSRLSNPA